MVVTVLSLVILGVSATWQDPTVQQIQPIGQVLTGVIVDVEAAPPYAFALEPTRLHVLDMTDPTDIRDVAQLELPGIRWRMSIHGSRLYLVGAPVRGLAVVDVSVPTEPRLLGELSEVSATIQDGTSVVGDTAFVVRDPGTPSLDVLDLAAPGDLPGIRASLDLTLDESVEISGTAFSERYGLLLLLVTRPGTEAAELAVVDVSDPSQPRLRRRLPLPDGRLYRDVATAGDRVVALTMGDAAGGTGGIAVFRFDGGEGLELLGETSDSRLEIPIDLVIRDQAVFATFKMGVDLAVFDIADPRQPGLVFTHTIDDPLAAGVGMALVGDDLYVASDGGSLPVFDVSDPLRPSVRAEWAFVGGWTGEVFVEDDLAVTVRDNSGFEAYDVADPKAPRRLSRFVRVSAHDPWQLVQVARRGPRVFVVYDTLPAELVDLSNPARAVVVRRFEVFSGVARAALTPTHAVLGFRTGRLELVDLAAPASTGAVQLSGRITDLSLRDREVVAAHFDGSLTIVDISDPAHPGVIGRVEGLPDEADDGTSTARVAMADDHRYAYVGHVRAAMPGTLALSVVDLDEPEAPDVVQRADLSSGGGNLTTFALGPHLAVRPGEVLITAGRDLLQVDVDVARPPRLMARYRLPRVFVAVGLATQGDVVWVGRNEFGLFAFDLPRIR